MTPGWLPFRSLVLRARHTPAELASLLAADVDEAAALSPFDPAGTRPWIGKVTTTGMELRRRVPFRSSFLPVVRARFLPVTDGTEAHVTMSLRATTRLIVGAWLLASVVAIGGSITTGRLVLIAVPVMCSAVLATGLLAFRVEADKAARYLEERLSPP